MGKGVFGYDMSKLTAISELLDEARSELRNLKANPIEIIPTTNNEDFKPSIQIYEDGSMSLILESKSDENNDLCYDLDELILNSISKSDSVTLEGFIVKLSQMLATAANRRSVLN